MPYPHKHKHNIATTIFFRLKKKDTTTINKYIYKPLLYEKSNYFLYV